MHSRFLLPAVAAFALSIAACGKSDKTPAPGSASAPSASTAPAVPAPPIIPISPLQGEEKQTYLDAAKTAWAFVENNYIPATGLTKTHETYSNITLWDIGGVIAAHYSAHRLGLIPDKVYDQRIQRVLKTLSAIPLVEKTAFNATYNGATGRMVTRAGKPTATGDGWSVTDLGRLLIWLKILAVNEPQYALQAQAIANRLDMTKLIADGDPQGISINADDPRRPYAETEIGYHQYASSGFAMWGSDVRPALDSRSHAEAVEVLGVPLVVDSRSNRRVMSEGYLMMGLETGWLSPELRAQAARVLQAQEARYKSTGIITMVTEDAMPEPPYYFYYYSVYKKGNPFEVEGPKDNAVVESPRWVSSKAAFAWNALMPSPYTKLVVKTVLPAGTPGRGWGSGVYEGTSNPVNVRSLNTAALILESALFAVEGKPIMPWNAPSA